MVTRLVLLGTFSLLAGIISVFEPGPLQWVALVLSAVAFIAMLVVIWSYKQITLLNGNLTLRNAFWGSFTFSLNEVDSWYEHSHWVNSVLRKHLIIYRKNGDKIVISNLDDISGYEQLSKYLVNTFPNRIGTK